MNRRDRRRACALAAKGLLLSQTRTHATSLAFNFDTANRTALLLSTALASTLLIVTVAVPTPAYAVQDCTADIGTGPEPIIYLVTGEEINCINTEPRTGKAPDFKAIGLETGGKGGGPIFLDSDGLLQSYNPGGDAYGIYTRTVRDNSWITITNRGDIVASATSTGKGDGDAYGIYAYTDGNNSSITVTNSGNIAASSKGGDAYGIDANSDGANSPVSVTNSGDITASAEGSGGKYGGGGDAYGIYASSDNDNSRVTVTNSGDITASSKGGDAYGIVAYSDADNSPVTINNTGDITATSTGGDASGLWAEPEGTDSSPITINNSGDITATARGSYINGNPVSDAYGIYAEPHGNSRTIINNSGDITATASDDAYGIYVYVEDGDGGRVTINNTGDITAVAGSGRYSINYGIGGSNAYGISLYADGDSTHVAITNSGNISATSSGRYASGIGVITEGANSSISIDNAGHVSAIGLREALGYGIWAQGEGKNTPITINNSGSVYASDFAIWSYSYYNDPTKIINTGDISAGSHLAIYVGGYGRARIYNAGRITGYVQLTDQNDRFVNQAGGVFETKKTSFFGGGNDLFVNQSGGTVLAATMAGRRESNGFEGLETFRNAGGLISMIDGGVGDQFTIANTPGGKNLNFQGGGFLGVDANLRGPGSKADIFNVDGNVSDQTKVIVNNTSTQPGVFNSQGIRVVNVMGKTPKASNFVLADGPIDTGLFEYDLFFTPTGSGHWDLRSFPGASAQALPKLLTASQDIWHQTSSTWFDRTADLRVVLNGGGSPAYDAGTKSMAEPGGNGLTPGVWIKGGGSRLDRDSPATTKAYGRNYTYDLDNELDTIDLQVGVDMGQYDVLSQGDVLIFGVLGGFVGAGLDYDSLADSFDFSGGQVGAYATYLKDGLFVDTLLNVHLYDINTPNFGFPDSLNATTVGLRTDAGYRFGSFTGGAFFEPLATIEVTWADIDGFNVGGNNVSFSDDANVRGRIGGRVGTTTQAWEGTMMEPFLIASLWGNLSEDNSATVVSTGRTFQFNDDLQDVWGELSAGVNLFNFSQTTAVFAKVDYTFGKDVQGVGGKAGMRVAW